MAKTDVLFALLKAQPSTLAEIHAQPTGLSAHEVMGCLSVLRRAGQLRKDIDGKYSVSGDAPPQPGDAPTNTPIPEGYATATKLSQRFGVSDAYLRSASSRKSSAIKMIHLSPRRSVYCVADVEAYIKAHPKQPKQPKQPKPGERQFMLAATDATIFTDAPSACAAYFLATSQGKAVRLVEVKPVEITWDIK